MTIADHFIDAGLWLIDHAIGVKIKGWADLAIDDMLLKAQFAIPLQATQATFVSSDPR